MHTTSDIDTGAQAGGGVENGSWFFNTPLSLVWCSLYNLS